jgi:predicted amidohydrolase YtcJ
MRGSVLMSLLLSGVAGCGQTAELVLTGGVVWTGTGDTATAIAIANGKIQAVGSDTEIARLAGGRTERVELGGRFVVPGFMDNHTHFVSDGFSLAGVQLRDVDSPQEFTRRIAERAQRYPGQWMGLGAWDHERWGGALPDRSWIDSVTGDTPVFVTRLDGHMGLANTRALALAGVTGQTADPPGGTIVRDRSGRATGVLKDAAMNLVFDVIPEPSEAELDRALEAASRHAVERGITHVTDMGTWAGLETYRRAARDGRLPLRVYAAVPIATWDRLAGYVAEHGRGDHRVAWGAVKGFVDGSLGSTTAWFHAPYDDAPETTGLQVTDTTELRRQILAADSAGLHVLVHAIGDRANDWLLDVFAEARARGANPAQRFRVEHAQHLTPAAIARFGAERVVPSMQPYHAIDDGRWAVKRIGPERIKTTYAFRSLLNAGAPLTFGSDWTVAPLDPLAGIYAAVTRRTLDGLNPGGWVPEQKITVDEALTAYTRTSAWADYLDEVLGTLEPGKYADLVVLAEDLRVVDPARIADVRVDLTVVNGTVVYRRP